MDGVDFKPRSAALAERASRRGRERLADHRLANRSSIARREAEADRFVPDPIRRMKAHSAHRAHRRRRSRPERPTSDFRESLSGGGLARLAADERRLMSGSATNSTFSPPANDGALAEFMLAEQRRALPPQGWRSEDLLCIVVGGHPRSEIADRPLGDWMARTIRRRLADRCGNASPLTPLVMSDFWYLNDRPLLQQPSIVIGEPGVNAAAAHHAVRLPQMLVLEDALRIHLDPEYPKLRACFWGAGPQRTEQAARIFADRYLDGFLDAALASVHPMA